MGDCSVLGAFGTRVKVERKLLVAAKRCPVGHPIAGDNQVLGGSGSVVCRKCKSQRHLRWYYRRQLDRYWLHNWPESTSHETEVFDDVK